MGMTGASQPLKLTERARGIQVIPTLGRVAASLHRLRGAAVTLFFQEDLFAVSIIRIGLAETKHFAEGYDAIFGKRNQSKPKKAEASSKKGKAKKKNKRGQK